MAAPPSLKPRPTAASDEQALLKAVFTKVQAAETQLFPGEINRVGLYRKTVKQGERFHFRKMVVLVAAEGAALRGEDGLSPVVFTTRANSSKTRHGPGP